MHKWSTVVLLSGGIDSAVCALIAAKDRGEFAALTIDYGQNPAELEAACRLAQYYSWTLIKAQITPFPASLDPAGANIIPARNAMFLSLATAMLDPLDWALVYIGSNADDQCDYPDCRSEFFNAWQNVCQVQGIRMWIKRPLINLTKVQVIAEARRRSLPIDMTVSCYVGINCGECNACKLRNAALAVV